MSSNISRLGSLIDKYELLRFIFVFPEERHQDLKYALSFLGASHDTVFLPLPLPLQSPFAFLHYHDKPFQRSSFAGNMESFVRVHLYLNLDIERLSSSLPGYVRGVE